MQLILFGPMRANQNEKEKDDTGAPTQSGIRPPLAAASYLYYQCLDSTRRRGMKRFFMRMLASYLVMAMFVIGISPNV